MADIIYPAAFHDGRAPQASAPETGLDTSPPTAGQGLEHLRRATEDTLLHLRQTHDEAVAIDRLGDDLHREAAGLDDRRRDLSHQMDRLIAETRRMTAYLRSEG